MIAALLICICFKPLLYKSCICYLYRFVSVPPCTRLGEQFFSPDQHMKACVLLMTCVPTGWRE